MDLQLLSVSARRIVRADPSLRYTRMFAGTLSNQQTNQPPCGQEEQTRVCPTKMPSSQSYARRHVACITCDQLCSVGHLLNRVCVDLMEWRRRFFFFLLLVLYRVCVDLMEWRRRFFFYYYYTESPKVLFRECSLDNIAQFFKTNLFDKLWYLLCAPSCRNFIHCDSSTTFSFLSVCFSF